MQTFGLAHIHSDIHTSIHSDIQTPTNRQTDIYLDRQTLRQTDRYTYIIHTVTYIQQDIAYIHPHIHIYRHT